VNPALSGAPSSTEKTALSWVSTYHHRDASLALAMDDLPGTVWLVLPTYNEAENLEAIVAAAREQLPDGSRILIVDDSSPDGTGEIADRLAADDDRIGVLHRPTKDGLGRAYVEGFRVALAGGADLIVQMDADFSHDPADLPRLIEAATSADLVLGSRYVSGGGVEDWGPLRRLISRGGSFYARTVLDLHVRDLTGGFKVFHRVLLERLDLDSISASGYTFQVETTYRAIRAGARVREIPIVFRDRQLGRSKMSGAIVLEAVWRVPALRLSRRRG
jgi:dolichol-phosphate mannosyltransferase